MQDAKQLVSQMTLEEKASLCSGGDMWHTKAVQRLGLPAVMLTDGPHGLRKQSGGTDHLGINDSIPATCFPTASATACSWDRELLHSIGQALARECIANDVAVILGPGANIKRSPLCGRNFEYISEDPYLTGELAAALIGGAQSLGVGTSLKHFAVNNQEERRMTIDAVVDERTLREVYLAGFEKAVKQAQPYTVMCSYNRLDGIYASEYNRLLNDILRDEWGFEGLVVTDWGACNDRVEGLAAGQDLEMPASSGINDAHIVEAVRSGRLSEVVLDRAAERLVKLVLRWAEHRQSACDLQAHHSLARSAAAQSAVLLKNEGGVLPLRRGVKAAVIGGFAKQPRYQGSGSSLIAPTRLERAWDEVVAYSSNAVYAAGYAMDSDQPNEALIDEACKAAAATEVALVFAGLPDSYESEGFDRGHMRMPEAHNELIRRVARANANTVVVLSNGAPVEMPWLNEVAAVLEGYLGGQGGAGAAADVLFGAVNPSGKLAETFPVKLDDVLSSKWFPMGPKTVEYREGLFVGYRWFDAAGVAPLFPFGHGLSYTTFDYADLEIESNEVAAGDTVRVSVTVGNSGSREGSEIVQLYLHAAGSPVFRPEKELKGFQKVRLQPGERKRVTFELDARAFAFYNTAISDWHITAGEYELLVGASSADIRLRGSVRLQAEDAKLPELPADSVYFDIARAKAGISDADFAALLGRPIPPSRREQGEAYDINSTLGDVRATFAGKVLNRMVMGAVTKMAGPNPNESMHRMIVRMMEGMPLRALVMMSQGAMSADMVGGLLLMMNGHSFKGMAKLVRSLPKKK